MVAEFKKERIMFGEIIIKLFINSHKPSVHKCVDRSKISLGNYIFVLDRILKMQFLQSKE